MTAPIDDLLVIGGGVNGGGIARDAAGRGLSVHLAEKSDLAAGTSSASTKLIHGGLRYLEHYAFAMVREALSEREVLWSMAPHIAWPLRFVLPHHSGLRPAWLIRLGLFLYDRLGGRRNLPGARRLKLAHNIAGAALLDRYTIAFEYSDCWVEDARLVVLNARDAAERGAHIHVRREVIAAERAADHWRVTLRGGRDRQIHHLRVRAIVNAAGPWVGEVLQNRLKRSNKPPLRLVKGSHIITRRLFDHDRAYILQNDDGRIVFAIPYEANFTLIGTTDVDIDGDPGAATISPAETDYLCAAINRFFATPITPKDVVATFAGVRPLYDDGAIAAHQATRDFVLELDDGTDSPPLLNIYGGKITTYRRLAEQAMAKLAPRFPTMGPAWTRGAVLPGGDFPATGFDDLVATFSAAQPALPATLIRRLARAYGTRARLILDGVETVADLGRHFGADLYARELDYMRHYEWARTGDDALWRRSKLGLRLTATEQTAVRRWFESVETENPRLAGE